MKRDIDVLNAVLAFGIIHLLIYPASNGFNSYYDRDIGSIGGVRNPPEVSGDLLWFSLLFDLAALVLALFINWLFAVGLFIYGLGSKSYSITGIRFKKKPIFSWFCVSAFGGMLIFLLTCGAVSKSGYRAEELFRPGMIIPAVLTTLYLMASYPLTQVYQHEEDGKRGDKTISMILGIKGTFIFSALFFIITLSGFIIFLSALKGYLAALLFIICQLPVIVYFIYWFLQVYADEKAADYHSAMLMNFISSTGTNIFCIILFLFFH
jgi:1,4-dihydroxy-2-naphthoate octaprenyltransferase